MTVRGWVDDFCVTDVQNVFDVLLRTGKLEQPVYLLYSHDGSTVSWYTETCVTSIVLYSSTVIKSVTVSVEPESKKVVSDTIGGLTT